MKERFEPNPTQLTSQELERQIRLAELNMQKYAGRTLEEVLVAAMGKFNDNPEQVAQSLLDQKVFEKTADCQNPEMVAKAVVERFIKDGQLHKEEK